MKGITPVIAIILLLLITISMVGFAFVWFNRMMTTATNETSRQTEEQMQQMGQKISIDSTTSTNIYIRNSGSVSIPTTKLAVYIDGAKQDCPSIPATIAPGAIYTCPTNNCTSGSGKTAKVVAPGNYDEVIC